MWIRRDRQTRGEVVAFGVRRPFEGLPDAGVPHRLLQVVGLRKDPRFRAAMLQAPDPRLVARAQAAQRQHALTIGGLRFVDIAAPVPLIDSDAALVEVDMLHLQASHFGNARPGIEARLADQQVRVFERLVRG